MKDFFTFTLTALLAIFLIQACGPSEEELQQQAEAQRQAEQDSLEQAWEAEMEQMRQDSIEQARQDSIARAEAEAEASEREETAAVTYDPDGSFTIQVRSWRSEERAEEHANQWRERGFEHVYIEEFGDESVGDVWFRVRLGNVSSHEMASKLQEKVKNEYNADAWISSVTNGN